MKNSQPGLPRTYAFLQENIHTVSSRPKDPVSASRPHCLYIPTGETKVNKKEIMEMIRMAQENERKQIGRELHDNVNQILTTVKMFMGMLKPVSAKDKEIQDKCDTYIMNAITEIRKISRELVETPDKEGKLGDRISEIIEDIHFSTSINIVFNYNPAIECLSRNRKTALLRIVQEQLKNIINHSRAKQVNIELDTRKGKVMMKIKDNGIGFNTAKTSTGIGLSNIYERVTFFEGSVDVKTAEGKGCELLVSLPAA